MRIHNYKRLIVNGLLACFCILLLPRCTNKQRQDKAQVKPGHSKYVPKPPSSYQDSLVVNSESAVFFHADSMQLQKLKSLLNDQVYKGSMHEFYFMMRNAHMFLHKNWPHLNIIEAGKVRYLLFKPVTGSPDLIDLNKEQDPFGMLVFDGKQKPLLVDMTNIDTQVPAYFQLHKLPANEAVK